MNLSSQDGLIDYMIKKILYFFKAQGKTIVNLLKKLLNEHDDLEEIDSSEYLDFIKCSIKE